MDLFDIFGITEEELKDEKKASAKPKKKEKKEKKEKRLRARGVKIRSRKTSAARSGNWPVSSSKFLL